MKPLTIANAAVMTLALQDEIRRSEDAAPPQHAGIEYARSDPPPSGHGRQSHAS